jgi:hypothetical protein
VEAYSGAYAGRQIRRDRSFDEVAEKTADEVVRVRAAQCAMRQEIHVPPIDGAAM